jgi:formylglycine-generating enzyme
MRLTIYRPAAVLVLVSACIDVDSVPPARVNTDVAIAGDPNAGEVAEVAPPDVPPACDTTERCGMDCRPCPAPPPNAAASCEAGRCGWICMEGFVRVATGPGVEGCMREPQSCVGLPATCGHNQDDRCCASDFVEGGEFSRGYDKSEDGQNVYCWQRQGLATAKITGFSLDRYEVTVGRFRKFLAAYDTWVLNNPDSGAGGHPNNLRGGWEARWVGRQDLYPPTAADLLARMDGRCNPKIKLSLQSGSPATDVRPMTCATWYEAFMFCIWDGARLPTEAEWNYAAAGGGQQRAYPWSVPPDSLAITPEHANVGRPTSDLFLEPVGRFPSGAGRWGHHDLAGNAWELVDGSCNQCLCQDPGDGYLDIGATDPLERTRANAVARGGSYKYGMNSARTAFRFSVGFSGERYDDLGFRCARPAVKR